MGKTLRVHDGILSYQYVLDGKMSFIDRDLIVQLANEAGYAIEFTGNGSANLNPQTLEEEGSKWPV